MVDTIKILESLLGNGALSQSHGNNVLGNTLGSLLGGLFGASPQQSGRSGGSMTDLLGSALSQFTQQNQATPQQQNYDHLNNDQHSALDQAELLIRAMINAAKADGRVDEEEQQKILGRLGDISPDEVTFIKQELAAPLDVDGFIRSIPKGFEQQVYIMSLMAIDLDTNHEAQYLHQLAQGLGLTPELCNQIHEKLGAQKLYG